jgi:hypothetical protein
MFLVCLYGSMAATIHSEKESSVVRREQRTGSSNAVHLSARGEFVRSAKKPRTMVTGDVHTEASVGWLEHPRMAFGVSTRLNLTDATLMELARYDFPLGEQGTNDCTHPDNEIFIDSPTECMFAADQSGAEVLDLSKFEIHNYGEWQDRHPKGCFKDACHEAANGICYFYNLKAGGKPTGPISGTPICQRPRFLFAEKDTNGRCDKVGGSGAGGYEAVMDENLCLMEGPLLGRADAPQVRAGIFNATNHLLHPAGCFLDETTNLTYYNPPVAGLTVPATGVTGIQVCNVTSVTTWPASGAL